MAEGFLIMKDVQRYIENVKAGNYNNYFTEDKPYQDSPRGSAARRGSNSQEHEQSVVGSTQNESVIKTKRVVKIRQYDKEMAKLQKRYEQIIDPGYISELKL